nr:hypothetical protein [uncultured Acetatifactor sp.]
MALESREPRKALQFQVNQGYTGKGEPPSHTGSDGSVGLMLICARLRHVDGSQWGNKKLSAPAST